MYFQLSCKCELQGICRCGYQEKKKLFLSPFYQEIVLQLRFIEMRQKRDREAIRALRGPSQREKAIESYNDDDFVFKIK